MPLLFPWLPNRHPALARLRGGEASGGGGGRRAREGGREEGAGQKTKKKKIPTGKTILSARAHPIEKSPGRGRAGVVRSERGPVKSGERGAKLASGVGFPWPVMGSGIVLPRRLAIFKYNGRNECK